MIELATEERSTADAEAHDVLPRRVSVVLITQDEEASMARAIASCAGFADEIVVIDGGSRDTSVAKARSLDCVVFENPWPGYALQRNFGIARASYDWIFLIDSDEVVGKDLSAAIAAWKTDANAQADAFVLTRRTDLLGRWMAVDPQVRLHRKSLRFRDDLVHEKLDLRMARVAPMAGTLWHFGFRSVADMVRRYNAYTDLEAEQLSRGRQFRVRQLLLRPIGRFVRNYFLRGLFIKGVPGLTKAALLAGNEFLAQAKMYEREWRANGSPHEGIAE